MTVTRKSNISTLNDPIEAIKLYLTYPEQGQSRLINREFNRRINKSHSTMRRQLERLSIYIERVFGAVETTEKKQMRAMRELQIIEDSLALNEAYIKAWPLYLEQVVSRCNSSLSAKAALKLPSLYHYRHLRELKLTEFQDLDVGTKLLIYASRMMCQCMLCTPYHAESRAYQAFSAFIVRSTWYYLSTSNNSLHRLPPLQSIHHLYLNEDIYDSEIRELRNLNNNHGLMIWCPFLLEEKSKFDPQLFCFFVGKMARVDQWFENEMNFDRLFPIQLRVEFVLNLLCRQDGVLDFHTVHQHLSDQYLEYFMFETVRRTLIALWRHQRFGHLMDKLMMGLLDSNTFDLCHHSFSLELINRRTLFACQISVIIGE